MAPGLFTTSSFLTSGQNNPETSLENNESTGASVSFLGNGGESTQEKGITFIVTTLEDNTRDLSSTHSTINLDTTNAGSSLGSTVLGGSKPILSSLEASTMGPSTGTDTTGGSTNVVTTEGGTPGKTKSESNTASATTNGNGHSD